MSSPSPAAPSTSSPSNTSSGPSPQQTAEARTAFLASLSSASISALQPLSARAADIHKNSVTLNSQTDSVEQSSQDLEQQNRQYEKILADAGGKLKEIGDVQNWAECLERDLLMLEETMGIVEGEEEMRRERVNGDGGGKGGR